MITVDARGEQCPIPVIKTKKTVEALQKPDMIEVFVDNEIAVQNLLKYAASIGAVAAQQKVEEKNYRVEITVSQTGEAATAGQPECIDCDCTVEKETIIVVSSAVMGTGNDELGKVLMKGFLYAVSQLDRLPEKVLFYNGGAQLSTEGSDSLEDLRSMEKQGVQILTCGTCLDYYGIKDKLAVGEVTNMYAIVEAMSRADRIIRP